MLAANVPFLDQLAFRKVKQELGGKLNFVASGAAPLSKNNQMFLRAYADTSLAPFQLSALSFVVTHACPMGLSGALAFRSCRVMVRWPALNP
jgi:hypothetical protein